MRTSPGSEASSQWLRLGILQNGQLVEEQLVPAGRAASVGTAAGCTVVLASEGAPRRWRLIDRPRGRRGRRLLRLAPGMEARLAVADRVTMVPAAPAGTAAPPLPLPPSARGRIVLGDVTILFQLLAPPPARPRPRLPASVRGGLREALDRGFSAIAVASLACHLALVLYLRAVDWPRRADPAAVLDRFVRGAPVLVIRPPAVAAAVPQVIPPTVPSPAARAPQAPARPEASTPPRRAATPLSTEERRRRLIEDVNRVGLVKIVGALGDRSHLANLLGAGDVDRPQEEALRDVGGLAVASADTLPGVALRDGAGGGRLAQVGELRDAGHIAAAMDVGPARERRVQPLVRVDEPAVDEGSADPTGIAREIRRRLSAVRACYERALKRNPRLGGKLTLRLTISPAGTVTDVVVDDQTLGDPELGDCLRGLLLRWRFAPPAGPVEISFPFVFQPVA
jgi:TonB family protein